MDESAGLIWLEDESCGALLEDITALLGTPGVLDMAKHPSDRAGGEDAAGGVEDPCSGGRA